MHYPCLTITPQTHQALTRLRSEGFHIIQVETQEELQESVRDLRRLPGERRVAFANLGGIPSKGLRALIPILDEIRLRVVLVSSRDHFPLEVLRWIRRVVKEPVMTEFVGVRLSALSEALTENPTWVPTATTVESFPHLSRTLYQTFRSRLPVKRRLLESMIGGRG